MCLLVPTAIFSPKVNLKAMGRGVGPQSVLPDITDSGLPGLPWATGLGVPLIRFEQHEAQREERQTQGQTAQVQMYPRLCSPWRTAKLRLTPSA